MQEAARCLNLSTDTIKALEEGACERLPGTTFAMGYLRAYAKFLKLDHEEIIAGTRLANDQACEILVTRRSLRRTTHRARPAKRGGLFFRVLLVVGVAGLMGIAVSQLPALGVNKMLTAFGLSPSVSHGGKPKATPPPRSGQSGDPQQPLILIE